jgi:Tfp pilus assembly protein PilF
MRLTVVLPLSLGLMLAGCSLQGPPVTHPGPGIATHPPGSPPSSPTPATPGGPEVPPGTVAPAAPPPPRAFHLSSASSALVSQAHRQAGSGDYAQAAATLERALRIEPDNPLVWIELGRVQLGENNPVQADSMGRKALSLATGDPAAQSGAWHLIADSYKARGRNDDASDAERRALSLASR